MLTDIKLQNTLVNVFKVPHNMKAASYKCQAILENGTKCEGGYQMIFKGEIFLGLGIVHPCIGALRNNKEENVAQLFSPATQFLEERGPTKEEQKEFIIKLLKKNPTLSTADLKN